MVFSDAQTDDRVTMSYEVPTDLETQLENISIPDTNIPECWYKGDSNMEDMIWLNQGFCETPPGLSSFKAWMRCMLVYHSDDCGFDNMSLELDEPTLIAHLVELMPECARAQEEGKTNLRIIAEATKRTLQGWMGSYLIPTYKKDYEVWSKRATYLE